MPKEEKVVLLGLSSGFAWVGFELRSCFDLLKLENLLFLRLDELIYLVGCKT